MQGVEGLVKAKEICERVGINRGLFYSWLRCGLLLPPHSWRYYGAQGSVAYYKPEAVKIARRVKDLRKRGVSVAQIRMIISSRLVEEAPVGALLGEVAVPVAANPGLHQAIEDIVGRLFKKAGREVSGNLLFRLERRGEEDYLVFTGIDY